MKTKLLASTLGSLALALWAHPALAQSANLGAWVAAGDTLVDSATSARLTTAALDSGETPLSASSALLYFDLEPALSLPVGALPADTFEGSGLQQSFTTLAATQISFNWSLSTLGFDGTQIDRAFIIVDGSALVPLGSVGATATTGSFSQVFGTGNHALAILVMDVDAADRVSTLTISNFNVSAVPEPTSISMWLLGLAGAAWLVRRRAVSQG